MSWSWFGSLLFLLLSGKSSTIFLFFFLGIKHLVAALSETSNLVVIQVLFSTVIVESELVKDKVLSKLKI